MEYSYAEFNITNLSRSRIDTVGPLFEDWNGHRTNGTFLFKDFIRANPSNEFQSQEMVIWHGADRNVDTRLFLAPGDVACCRIPTNMLTGVRRISVSYISRNLKPVDSADNILIKLLDYVGIKKHKHYKVAAVWCDVPNGKPSVTTGVTNSLSR
jgi:hypothetical protein